MSNDDQQECERLCKAVIQEKDPEKLSELVKALNDFLQRREQKSAEAKPATKLASFVDRPATLRV